MDDAQAVDGRYHTAKLQSWAFSEPQLIHDEHTEWKSGLLQPTTTATPDLLQAAADLHHRSIERGLIVRPPNGAS